MVTQNMLMVTLLQCKYINVNNTRGDIKKIYVGGAIVAG